MPSETGSMISFSTKVTPSTPGAPSLFLASAYAWRRDSILQTWTSKPQKRQGVEAFLGQIRDELVGRIRFRSGTRSAPIVQTAERKFQAVPDVPAAQWAAAMPTTS
jgi:hypothetical protein